MMWMPAPEVRICGRDGNGGFHLSVCLFKVTPGSFSQEIQYDSGIYRDYVLLDFFREALQQIQGVME